MKKWINLILDGDETSAGLVVELLSKDYKLSDWIIDISRRLNSDLKREYELWSISLGDLGFDETSNPGRGKKRNNFLANKVPIQRLGQPEEIGKTVKWLISEDSDYISGQVIVADGGFQNSGSRGENF